MTDGAEGLGTRLKRLRQEQGTSQVELAGEELSASYVSLLESGKRVPTRRVLEYLASRLGVSPDHLLTGAPDTNLVEYELELRYAELALQSGEAEEAERRLATLAEDTATRVSTRHRQRTLWASGRAAEARARLESAIQSYSQLVRELEETGQGIWEAEVAVALSRCYREVGDIDQAIAVGERASRRLQDAGLDAADVAFELASTLVLSYYFRGDMAHARLLADQGVQESERQGSRRARGAAYWNASLVAQAQGRHLDALALADRALAMYAEGADDRALGRLRSTQAWLLLRQQPPEVEKALEALDKAENLLEGVGTDIDRAYCYTERARAFFLLGTFSGAREAAASALARLGSTPRPESATVLALLGQIALAEGDPRGALQATVEAAQMLHDTGTGREAAELWRELAETFAATGESVRAMEAFRRMAELLGVQAGPVLPQQPATIVLTDAEQVRR